MHLARAILFCTVVPASAAAQCALTWLPGAGNPGTDRQVHAATAWDPDGAGPLTPRVVFGGSFTVVGGIQAARIAAYDPATGAWQALGSGMDRAVLALAVLPNGDLVAGGEFTTAGGVSASCIARWTGSTWLPLGSGISSSVDASVRALVVRPNGQLIAGGSFITAGGVNAYGVAAWNGASWFELTGNPGGGVNALANLPNGDLAVGGLWFQGGFVRRWNGVSWSALGSGMDTAVHALTTLSNGDLVAAGDFQAAGGAPAVGVARWNGTAWSAMDAGLGPFSRIQSLQRLPNGDLVAGHGLGNFTGFVKHWNGTTWSPLLQEIGMANALCVLPSGDVFAGGSFTIAGGVGVGNVARWNGATWSALGPGTSGVVHDIAELPNGDIVVGGYVGIPGVGADGVARWTGSAWSSLGANMDDDVLALAVLPSGDLIAGGRFTTAGGASASHLARFDGASWTSFAGGTNAPVHQLVVMPDGDLVALGEFTIAGGVTANGLARWDGATWSAVSVFFPGTTVLNHLIATPDGDLLAAGSTVVAPFVTRARVYRHNGVFWSEVGPGSSFFGAWHTVAQLLNGDVVAGGNGAARWDGTAWSVLDPGLGFFASLATLPDGDLVAGGQFAAAGSVPARNIARWDGSTWSAFNSDVFDPDAVVRVVKPLRNGRLALGGSFAMAGGQGSALLAVLATPCPATAVGYGSACAGSAGPLSLTATSLPWIGGEFRASAGPFAANSFALSLLGTQTINTPVSAFHPAGVAGCSVLTSIDAGELLVPSGGTLQFGLPVPDTPALVGVAVNLQVAQVELDAQLAITGVTTSNALRLTIGSF